MTTGNPWDTEEFRAYETRVRTELVPMIEGSAVGASIVPVNPEDVDVKFAVELGLMIMMDKPIILIVQPGTKLPEHLVRTADEIVEFGPHMGEAIAAFATKPVPTGVGTGGTRSTEELVQELRLEVGKLVPLIRALQQENQQLRAEVQQRRMSFEDQLASNVLSAWGHTPEEIEEARQERKPGNSV